MTLNTVIQRIGVISLAHLQVRTFKVGEVSEFLTEKTIEYAAVFLQYNAANISLSGKSTTIPFKLWVMDLVHASTDAKDNEQDVLSDTLSIAEDMIASLSSPLFDDWKISTDNPVSFVTDGDGDRFAGCVLDISVSTMFKSNRCQVPATTISATRLMINNDYFLLIQ